MNLANKILGPFHTSSPSLGLASLLIVAASCGWISTAQAQNQQSVAATQSQETVLSKSVAPQPSAPVASGPQPSPFQISVDGAVQSGSQAGNGTAQGTDIKIQFDGLNIEKSANIVLLNPDSAEPVVDANGNVTNTHSFAAYWNYSYWVKRAEVRIFDVKSSVKGRPVQVLPVAEGKVTPLRFVDSSLRGRQLQYVLRVYDENGTWDETTPKLLLIDDRGGLADGDSFDDLGEAWDQNTLAVSSINVSGGAVTVFGRGAPQGHLAYVLGERVPVDSNGDFVAREILPAGSHQVSVAVVDLYRRGLNFSRELTIPEDEVFYVALGDLTVGSTKTSGPAAFVGDTTGYGDIQVDGRVAFFVRGKIRGDVLLTAMADTGHGTLEEIIQNIDKKDPANLLDRIDPDKYYPVYGDDSTIENLAPTQGKFYVRIEKDESYAMWGNYQTNITGNQFITINRGLYGASAQYLSNAKNNNGDSHVQVQAFAAQPGTLPQRDEFRGTGGSLYFLSNQDITVGSEKVRIEARDANTGVVLNSRELVPEEDYDVDYIQGRIILSYPLQSTFDDNFITTLTPNGGGNPAYLVVNYEFTPTTTEIGNNYLAGGRLAGWIGDNVGVGVTGQYDNTTGEEKTVIGADVKLQISAGTYIKGEVAQSAGTAVTTTASSDGGFTSCNSTNSNTQAAPPVLTPLSSSLTPRPAPMASRQRSIWLIWA